MSGERVREPTRTIARRLVQADEPAWNGEPLGEEMGLLNFLNGLAPQTGWSLKRLFDETGRSQKALFDLGTIIERALRQET